MLIIIEGCIGAGKSTVTQGLAAYRGSQILLEDFEANPFLRDFYEDPVGNATETEFAFLLIHFHQLKSRIDVASRSEVIADFHLGKDLIYADLNMQDTRLKRSFVDLYEICLEKTPRPALMICLSASTSLVVDRIRSRKRDFELEIDPEYFATLNTAYEEYFQRYSGKKLRISMDKWDFVKDPSLYERLTALVDEELDIR